MFCYVHNYAFFTLAGQAVFTMGVIIRVGWRSRHSGWSAVTGFLAAVGFGVALYSPWLPAFYAQAQEVSAGYWIEDPTWRETAQLFSTWTWGGDFGMAATALALALTATAAVVVIRRRDRLGLCFLAQAALPWCIALAISWTGPTSILQDRYLSFAQLFLFCLAARALTSTLRGHEQALAAALLASLLVLALHTRAERTPTSSLASFPAAAGILAQHYRPDDVIAVARAGDVNLVRYYLQRFGVRNPDVRFSLSRSRGVGHLVHLGSVAGEDVLWPEGQAPEALNCYWQIARNDYSAPPPPSGMTERFRFSTPGEPEWLCIAFERSDDEQAQ